MSTKYMITWNERPQGSPIEYENAQKRILEVFTQWEAPSNFSIELFVIRVGDWGGYMMLDCDEPLAVHKFCSMLPSFVFEVRPLGPVLDAVRVEQEAIAFRDGVTTIITGIGRSPSGSTPSAWKRRTTSPSASRTAQSGDKDDDRRWSSRSAAPTSSPGSSMP